MRKLVDELRELPTSEVLARLRGVREYDLGIMSGIHAGYVARDAKRLGLNVVTIDKSETTYLPIHKVDKHALVIEDDDLAKKVTQKMLDEGVPIIEGVQEN